MLVIQINKKGNTGEIFINNEKASPEDLLRTLREQRVNILAFTTWEEKEKKLEGYIFIHNQIKIEKIVKKIIKAQIK